MAQGIQGTYVIAWSQVVVDGMPGVQPEDMLQGARWGWRGEPVRIDGPPDLLLLGNAVGQQDMRGRAAKVVKKLVGATVQNRDIADVDYDEKLGDQMVLLTDGRTSFVMTLIDMPNGPPLAMFVDNLPPQGQDLWVVDAELRDPSERPPAETGGIICFSGGTLIKTPMGDKKVSDLEPGDVVQTRDNGTQPVLWVGKRRVSGARLHVMPQMRPIRVRQGALGQDAPRADILVSPHHRMLVTGRIALDLFNSDEVLVMAKDLINGRNVYPEPRVKEVTYYHILMAEHEILQANGVWSESFQPAQMDLTTLEPDQREQLFLLYPDLEWDNAGYGNDARRTLSRAEAAFLQHAK